MNWVWCHKTQKPESFFILRSPPLGNDFNGITIQSKEIIERVKKNNYPFTAEDNKYILKSPDGYAFYVVDENTEGTGEMQIEFCENFK